MKKLITVALLTSVLGVTTVYAEEPKPAPGFDRFAKALELQDSQREPVQKILERQHEELKKLHQDTFKTLKEKEAKIHENYRKQLGKVLTKEQQEKLKQLHEKRAERFKEREQHRDHHKGHGKDRGPGKGDCEPRGKRH